MEIELNSKQKDAFQNMKYGKNIFLTGPGGSGKSFLLKYFIEYYKNEIETEDSLLYVTSTTGLSASLIDGITINHYASIGLGDKDVDYYYKKIIKMKSLRNRWIKTKILIIDEISMMDPELFDKLEFLARKIRKNKNIFGGIQVILSGDFLQLPPVKCKNFCFEALNWNSVIEKTFYFDKIIRQDDNLLQNVLNNIRIGKVNEEVIELLDSCLNRDLTNKEGIIPTLLFSKKNMVIEYNEKELGKLINDKKEYKIFESNYKFKDKITEESKEKLKILINNKFQVDDKITLSINSQVMLTINFPDKGLSNGSRGIVIDFTKDENRYPVVLFLNGQTMIIEYYEYKLIEENQYEKDEFVTKCQIPLILSWAITIHKAQGMSLEYVKTDIGSSIFEYGQAYVVLSRIKSIEGLSLINIDYSKIKAHPKILKYYEEL